MENKIATLGNGCFWCTEAIFQKLKGVTTVQSGFSGGHIKNPAYREVVTGRTGHAEVLQISYDENEISFEKLLEVFFATHDPTTLNRQGNDVGTQYRSAIYFHDEFQKNTAEKVIASLEKLKVYPDKIVTEVTEYDSFYPAEDYHTNYFELHKHEPYCNFVIKPKQEKFEKYFSELLK